MPAHHPLHKSQTMLDRRHRYHPQTPYKSSHPYRPRPDFYRPLNHPYLPSVAQARLAVDRDDLEHEEIVVRRTWESAPSPEKLLAWIDQHLATAKPHPAGTTDRYLEADRERPY